MLRFKRKTCKYSLIGVLLVTISACGSSGSDDLVDIGASDISASSTNPFDAPDQPVEPTPPADDDQVQTESPEDSQALVGASSDTSSITGLWDVTRTTSEGNDVVSAMIGSNGELTEFDFQGDSTGDGREFYLVRNQQIASRGATNFIYRTTARFLVAKGLKMS